MTSPVDRDRARVRRRSTEPRPLVMVADVSGSMESFTRIYLHLLRAFAQRPEIASFEAFVFATGLHRVTPALRQRDAGAVIDRLTAETADRFGGTRIATNLGRLLTGTRWSNAVRGATVVMVSDGWDADAAEQLGRRMARLGRMAHRVVWVNPRAGDQAWRPEVAGMAAALPHVDQLCSGHSLRAMATVIDAIGHRS
ncbi:MAG: VWA domain-containing protein [Actinomycetota bacterium]